MEVVISCNKVRGTSLLLLVQAEAANVTRCYDVSCTIRVAREGRERDVEDYQENLLPKKSLLSKIIPCFKFLYCNFRTIHSLLLGDPHLVTYVN